MLQSKPSNFDFCSLGQDYYYELVPAAARKQKVLFGQEKERAPDGTFLEQVPDIYHVLFH